MFKFNLQDISSDVEVIVFPREASKIEDSFFQNGEVITITGSVSKDGDEENVISKVIFNSCEKLDLSSFAGGTPIYLKVDGSISKKIVDKIYDIIKSKDGGSNVFLTYKEGSKNYTFKFNKKTSLLVKNDLEKLLMEKTNDNW